jgi:hypothetical protein
MIALELTRSPDDRRLYVLERAGTLRLEGLFSRNATAEGGRESWHFARSGFWQRVMQAMDALGSVVGEFVPRDLGRGGRLHWAGRESRCARPAAGTSVTRSPGANASSSSSRARVGAAGRSR